MQAVLPEITSLGANLIVLSPQLREFTKPGADRHKLTFPILTDHDNKVGEAYGLAFRLPDDLIEVYPCNGGGQAMTTQPHYVPLPARASICEPSESRSNSGISRPNKVSASRL